MLEFVRRETWNFLVFLQIKIHESLTRQRKLQELIKRNREELENRRRARAAANENQVGGSQNLAMEDTSDQESNSDDSDYEAELPRRGIREVVAYNARVRMNAEDADNDATMGIDPETVGNGNEASVSGRNILAIGAAAAMAEERDVEEIGLKTFKIQKMEAGNDVAETTLKTDILAPTEHALHQDEDATPAPEKRSTKKTGRKSLKITTIGADRDVKGKTAVDIPHEEFFARAVPTTHAPGKRYAKKAGMKSLEIHEMSADSGEAQKAAVGIIGEELYDQAGTTGMDRKMGAENDGDEIIPKLSVDATDEGACMEASMAEKGLSTIKRRSCKRRVTYWRP